jgi:hypothetical protein
VVNPGTHAWQYCGFDRGMIRIAACPKLTAELFSNPPHYCWPSKRWQKFGEQTTDTLRCMIEGLKMLNSKKMSEMLNDNVHKKLFPTWL